MMGIILICQMAAADCNPQTAAEVMRVPERFDNMVQCLVRSQAYLANQARNRGDISENSRYVIVCQGANKGHGPDQSII